MTDYIPPLPSDSETGAAYFLVTPTGLALGIELDDAPLRTGTFQPTVHRAAFSFFQARTDDGLPSVGETAVNLTLRADTPEELQQLISDLRSVARLATWLVHPVEGAMRLRAPTGVDVGASTTDGRRVGATLHLVALDLRRYAQDGSVMP